MVVPVSKGSDAVNRNEGRETWRFDTLAVHGGYAPEPTTKAVAVPIYQTTSYAFDSAQHGADLFDLKVPGNIYTRIMNPTQDVLEQRLAALEGGVGALALASGQAAVTYSILTIAGVGDNIVASNALYGGTYNLFAHTLPQYGITVRFADYRKPDAFGPLIDEKTKAVFVESLGNPDHEYHEEAVERLGDDHDPNAQPDIELIEHNMAYLAKTWPRKRRGTR